MGYFAVIDTETNWNDQVMSIGIVIAETQTFRLIDKKYYVIDPAYQVGGMFSGTLNLRAPRTILCQREKALAGIVTMLKAYGTIDIFAYNAKFDYRHLPELCAYSWYDIMEKAAYRQYNHAIPATAECCSTGRLKTGYGVESMLRLLTGKTSYHETHNAEDDAVDELEIMKLLNIPFTEYKKINP